MFDGSEATYHTALIEGRLPEGSPTWTALHPQLPGCNATGLTQDEALENLAKSKGAWLKVASDLGEGLPTPADHAVLTIIYANRPDATDVTIPEAEESQREKVAA